MIGTEKYIKKKILELAKTEVNWQKFRNKKSKEEFIEHMSLIYSSQLDISYNVAELAVLRKLDVESFQDMAKRYENNNEQNQADICWCNVEEALRRHFELLAGFI